MFQIQKYYSNWKSDKIHNITANLGLLGQIVLYLLPGFLLLIFLPSVAIMIFEGWDYDVAVYYAFVTLTTIGFGDYVAGKSCYYNVGNQIHNLLFCYFFEFKACKIINLVIFSSQPIKSSSLSGLSLVWVMW